MAELAKVSHSPHSTRLQRKMAASTIKSLQAYFPNTTSSVGSIESGVTVVFVFAFLDPWTIGTAEEEEEEEERRGGRLERD